MNTTIEQAMPTEVRGAAPASYRDREEWLKERQTGIGGSEIAALFGEHPFLDAHTLWLEKMGRAPERIVSPDMRRGQRLEDIAAEMYVERTGRRVRRQPLRRYTEQPILLASIDRQILAGSDAAGVPHSTGALELKVPRTRTCYRIKREGLPPYIVLQGIHEALVWGYTYTAFGIYNADDDEMMHFDIPYDPAVGRRIVEVASDWWDTHVIKGREPEENVAFANMSDLPEVKGDTIFRTDEEFARAARDYIEAQGLEKEAKAVKETARGRIIGLIDEKFGAFEHKGVARIYYSEDAGKAQHAETVKAVKSAHPLDRLKVADYLHTIAGVGVDEIPTVLESCTLDIAALEKKGKPSKTLRVYPLRVEE